MKQPAHDTSMPPIEQFEWLYTRARLRDGMRTAFGEIGITLTDEMIDRIMDTPAVRNAVIINIYNAERARGVKAERLYYLLGDVFGLDSRSVRNLVVSNTCANNTVITV